MTTLFGGATPGGSQFLDGSPGIKVCTTFTFHNAGVGVAGQVTEIWFYVGAQTGGTWTVLGWEVTNNDVGAGGTGTLVASQAFSGTPTANAWNKVTLSSPVSIPADYNRRWRFGVHNPQYYWAQNSFFDTHDETNAPITAYRDNDTTSTLGAIYQGTFAIGSSTTTYPAQTGSKANYAIDVTFVASGGTTPFTRDYASTWRVFNAITRDYASTWRVLNSLTRDYASSWRVLNALTTDYTSSWRVFNSFLGDYASTWRVLNSWTSDYSSTWRVFGAFVRDYASTWRVFRGFIRDYASTWAVLSDTPQGLILQVWTGGQLIAVSSLAVWNGSDEIPAVLEEIVGL